MAKLRKVYLPKWMGWFVTVIIVPMWSWLTYQAFFTEAGRAELGTFGWTAVSIVLLVSMAVVIAMSRRKLPAYLIHMDEEEEAES